MAMSRVLVVLLACLAVAQVGEGSRWWYKKKYMVGKIAQRAVVSRVTKVSKSATERVSHFKKKLEHIDSSSSSSSSSSASDSNEGSRETFENRDVRFLKRYGDIRHSSYGRYLSMVNMYYGQGYGSYRMLSNPYDDDSYTFATYNSQRNIPGLCNFNQNWLNNSPNSYSKNYAYGYSNINSNRYRNTYPGAYNARHIQRNKYYNSNPYISSRDINFGNEQVPYENWANGGSTPTMMYGYSSYNTALPYGSTPYGPRSVRGPYAPSGMNYNVNRYTYNSRTDIFGRSLAESGPMFQQNPPPMWNFGLPNYYNGHYSRALDVYRGEYDYLTTYNEFKFDRYGLYQLDLFKEFFQSLDRERFNIIKDIRYPADYTPYLQPDMTVDFIIIGAGPTGCLLANLLSQNFNWNVLLIEAGGHPPPAAEIPLLYSTLARSEFDWDYNLEVADTVGLGMRNGEIRIHVGKGLGGSALTVPDLYYRGCVKDYQHMVETGLIEYSFPSLLRFFMKTEHLRSTLMIHTDDIKINHGFGGPLPVSKITSKNYKHVTEVYSTAFSELGYHAVLDINDAKVDTGYVDMVGHVLKGRRMLPGKVFLSPIIQRNNFKLLLNTLVTKILIDTNTNMAYGVELVTKHGQMFTVQASKEVIVTAGAVGSAQLLLLSGIGPRHQLLLHDIDTVKDLPVGANLKLNAVFSGAVMAHKKPLMRQTSVEDMAFDYLAHNDGPLATFGTFSHTVFLDTLTKDYPEVEFHSYYFNQNHHEWLCDFKAMFNYADDYRTKLAQMNDQYNLAVYALTLLRPYSSGRVILESKNPFDRPIIVGNVFSDETDIESMLIALEKISALEETEAFKAVGSKLVPIEVPECSAYEFKSKDYWRCALKYFTTATSKPSGTCKMGVASDPTAVVDSLGNVYGVSRLRVAGSAVFPDPLTAYSSAPVLMLAERIAEHIMISQPF